MCSSTEAQQHINLLAKYDPLTSRIILDWNMITSNAKTGYVLLKSTDGNIWIEYVRDKKFRYYSAEDAFYYEDKNIRESKSYYRLKIINSNSTTLAVSDIVIVVDDHYSHTLPAVHVAPTAKLDKDPTFTSNTRLEQKSTWTIFPNPVHDILNLAFKGPKPIEGCINITIQDMGGKIVTRYRCASTNTSIHVPVSNLITGTYVIQLTVTNQLILNQRFLKN